MEAEEERKRGRREEEEGARGRIKNEKRVKKEQKKRKLIACLQGEIVHLLGLQYIIASISETNQPWGDVSFC